MRGVISFFLVIIWSVVIFELDAQIYINEMMASNDETISDPLNAESADWIELYNAGAETVSLKGYYLSDNLSIPDKWQINVLAEIPANGYLLIWADGLGIDLHAAFKLSADGEELGLYSPTLQLIDSVRFDVQQTDISFGRNGDGNELWSYFTSPTPNSKNSSKAYTGFVHHMPQFSIFGGVYDNPQTVSLSTLQGGEIRYTLDGSEPDENSNAYNEPILIDSTTIIRACIFEQNKIPGPVYCNTYFFPEKSVSKVLPIISIAANPEDIWDSEKGIYVQDFKPEWEVPINIEFFENDGSDRALFNERAGAKINGLWSWQLPQKMLGIYFRKKYGEGSLNAPLFSNSERNSFDSFALRASGSDWSYTMFRDMLGQGLAGDLMGIDIQKFRPCEVYINGAYMGIHNIREKVEADFIVQNHKLEEGQFDMVENEDFAESGDLLAYNEFLVLLGKDLRIQANLDALDAVMDIQNFTDYFIAETYVNNSSITHNVMAWKPKGLGKWKWILMDLDRGFFDPDGDGIDHFAAYDVFPFKELIRNETYKNYFVKRLADQLYTNFSAENVIEAIESHQNTIREEMPKHIDRWLGTTSDYGDALPSFEAWENNVCELKMFANQRPSALYRSLMSEYGVGESVPLHLAAVPQDAGRIVFNGFDLEHPSRGGIYPKGFSVRLEAKASAGFEFSGWAKTSDTILIGKKSDWKYDDSGSFPGESWYLNNFNDASWKEGQGELGYGDGDETTLLRSSSMTCYFRKTFKLNMDSGNLHFAAVNLMRDDGAVVYINGHEVLRSNMPCGVLDHNSLALNTISNEAESAYSYYGFDSGVLKEEENLIAVEVHQRSASSSDISFDLELMTGSYKPNEFISNAEVMQFDHAEAEGYVAVFETSGACVLPAFINEDLTLNKACSPYLVSGTSVLAENASLRIEPGVELWFSDGAGLLVHGEMEAVGLPDEEIVFCLNPQDAGGKWKNLSFRNTTGNSILKYVVIQDASQGENSVNEVGAISAFYADLVLDNILLVNNYGNPIHARYSNIELRNSTLKSKITGDLINVKYGTGLIENCSFEGNDQPDTDAIDFDDVENGSIANCRIFNFYGVNSDGIDIGEKSRDVRIDSVWISNINDKGISVGQRSSAVVTNCSFVNCYQGLGLKDSCYVRIDHCNFYGNGVPVSCFEKNIGFAGGNAHVMNSILSNSYQTSYFSDLKSTLEITYCISDNDSLPDGRHNLFGDPQFINPNQHHFQLQSTSMAKAAANLGEDMGVNLFQNIGEHFPVFSKLYLGVDDPLLEFIGLTNPGTLSIDVSGFEFDKGISYTFPQNSILDAGETIYLTSNVGHSFWYASGFRVVQWQSGKLSNEGEALQLRDSHGIVADYLSFQQDGLWPDALFVDAMISLKGMDKDNHFPTNWMAQSIDVLQSDAKLRSELFTLYPNPSSGHISIQTASNQQKYASVFSILGHELDRIPLLGNRPTVVDAKKYGHSILLIKVGSEIQRVLLLK